MESESLYKIIDSLVQDLGDGLVATDIWIDGERESLVELRGRGSPPGAIDLFNDVTKNVDKALKGADFPGLGHYYIINLSGNHLVVVLLAGSFRQYLLVDLSKTTMGILISVALPNLISALANAKAKEVKQSRGTSGFWKLLSSWSMGGHTDNSE